MKKRCLSLLPILLALGSCQSDNAPTQTDPSSDRIGVAARLFSAKALPQAQFFRARLTVGDAVGDWVDAAYSPGAELILGKVRRGTVVVLDVRGYSVNGTDTLWKWFAHKSDSATGSVLTIEAEVKGIEAPAPAIGQSLVVPVGSWYTTDTTSWAGKAIVDSSGTIPALSGTVLLVRLRMAVPGTKDTLLGEVLRYALPRKPTLLPANRTLRSSDSVEISGASGDSLVFCEGAGCTNWSPYGKALAPKAFVLRARALRNGLVSPIEEAAFTLAPADTTPGQPIDSVVGNPSISPNPGALAPNDSIRITPAKAGDSLRYSTDGGTTWSGYSGPIKAGAFTLAVVSLRGKFHSDTVGGAYTLNTSKPSSPTISSNCDVASDCDPGTTVELSSTDSGVSLQYALLADSTDWKPYPATKIVLSSSTKVFARAVRGSDISAEQTAIFNVVQPDTVTFSSVRQTNDTAWVKLSTKSGTIWFSRNASMDSSKWAGQDSIPVRASDSLFAWTWRGTARSASKAYHAQATASDPVGKPSISPNSGAVASSDFISITPARPGDSIRYTTNGTDWLPYIDPFKAGAFTVRAVAFREGLRSDTASATYTLSATKPSSPIFVHTCADDVCDPGDSIGISTTDTGVVLQYALAPDSTKWIDGNRFPLSSTSKVYARAIRNIDISATRSATITVAQPDTVAFAEAKRNPDTVWVKLSTTSGTIWYTLGAIEDSAKYSDSIPVRVLDSARAWASRGTARSDVKTFRASPVKPVKPTISRPIEDVIATSDSIELEAATPGDTLQYDLGAGWQDYKGKIAPGAGGPFTISIRAKRNGLVSDTAMRTYTVDTAALRGPTISPSIAGKSDPGTQFTIDVDSGSTLEWSNDPTKPWIAAASPLKFTADKDTTIRVRAITAKKTSAPQTFDIRIQQPDTVRFIEVSRTPDSVELSIVPADGDLVLYARNAEATSTNAPTSGAVTIMVRVRDSITAWTKRGTAYGGKRGYMAAAIAPKAPSLLPGRGHVHDTTDVVVAPATAGDSLYYMKSASEGWTPYVSRLHLDPGIVTVFARSVRNGLSTDTSATFTVHAKPDTVGFSGCLTDCDPGTTLTINAKTGYVVKWAFDTTSGWAGTANAATARFSATDTVWAYADSSGHRSKAVSRVVQVTPPVNPSITGVKVVRAATFDSAYYTVEATQAGDTLVWTFGSSTESKQAISMVPFTKTIPVKRTLDDSVLMVWTKRGNSGSLVAYDTLSRLPPPKNDLVGGVYPVGKSFRFSLDEANGALSTDIVRLSTDSGSSWTSIDSVELQLSTQVWAKTLRESAGGRKDSSWVYKVAYGIDSSILSKIAMLIGTGTGPGQRVEFDMTTPVDQHTMTVADDVAKLGVDFVPKGSADEIASYEVRCDNCTDTSFRTLTIGGSAPTLLLNDLGLTMFTFRVATPWGFVRTHSIVVQRTAPWNGGVTFGTITDARDQETYKTVSIDGKTWIAENLRFSDGGLKGRCSNNDTAHCREFGRFYTWSEAMGLPSSCDAASCSTTVSAPHPGICPDGFHVPTPAEWETIATFLGDTLQSESLAARLRSKSYWTSPPWDNSMTPLDSLGMRVLAAGGLYPDGTDDVFGYAAFLWTTLEASWDVGRASTFMLGIHARDGGSFGVAQILEWGKKRGHSLRCVK